MKAVVAFFNLGLLAIIVCSIGMLIGAVLQFLIPGCSCGGARCNGCYIFDGLISLLIYGGFTLMMSIILYGIPTAIFIGLISTALGSKGSDKKDKS